MCMVAVRYNVLSMIAGSGLWRALCDLVLVGLILFAATVVYPVIKDGNVGNLVSTEEGR